jgi:hypothetical protein
MAKIKKNIAEFRRFWGIAPNLTEGQDKALIEMQKLIFPSSAKKANKSSDHVQTSSAAQKKLGAVKGP